MGAVRTRSNDDDGGKNKASEAKWQTFHPLGVLRGWESSKDAVATNHSHFQWGETTPVRPLITCQDSSIHNISSNGQFFSKDRLLFIGFLFSGQYGATQLQQLGRLLGSNGNFAFQTKERQRAELLTKRDSHGNDAMFLRRQTLRRRARLDGRTRPLHDVLLPTRQSRLPGPQLQRTAIIGA